MKRYLAPVILILTGLIVAVWLLTTNVTVSERNVDGVPAACGAAYDVVFLKQDGFMGGEVPKNQGAIDQSCRREARRDVAIGGLAGLALVALGAFTFWRGRRPSTQHGVRHEVIAR